MSDQAERWVIVGKGTIRSNRPNRQLVAKVHWVDRERKARLIAEAPAMYEALRAIVDDLQGLSHEPTVRAILARIEGEGE